VAKVAQAPAPVEKKIVEPTPVPKPEAAPPAPVEPVPAPVVAKPAPVETPPAPTPPAPTPAPAVKTEAALGAVKGGESGGKKLEKETVSAETLEFLKAYQK